MSHEHAMHEEPVDEDPAHAQHMPVQERVQSGGGHEGHDMSMPEPSALRDPHAYSGGFVRHSGLYALEMDAPMEMSDIKHFAGLRVDRLETVNDGGAALEGWAWMGDSYNRLRMKGKAVMVDDRLDEGTLDLVASHAVSPFWDVYAGVGMLSHEDVSHHHALLGLKGLAPYWFEIDASLMVDQRGRVGLRLEADYEWLLTQRWILQPRLDLAAYSRSDRSLSRGEGLSEVLTGCACVMSSAAVSRPMSGWSECTGWGRAPICCLPTEEPRIPAGWRVCASGSERLALRQAFRAGSGKLNAYCLRPRLKIRPRRGCRFRHSLPSAASHTPGVRT
ncbi:MAG: copper resistance protein B [Pseudomonadales bacterium]|nr:copper resistance protein B [Pseudomonadales bacterium]